MTIYDEILIDEYRQEAWEEKQKMEYEMALDQFCEEECRCDNCGMIQRYFVWVTDDEETVFCEECSSDFPMIQTTEKSVETFFEERR